MGLAGQNGEGLAEQEASKVAGVSMKTPIDSILKPVKLARGDNGSAIPTSCEALFGSSPDLHHKDPASNSCSPQLPPGSERVGEEFSQSPWGSSISPQEDSARRQDSGLE